MKVGRHAVEEGWAGQCKCATANGAQLSNEGQTEDQMADGEARSQSPALLGRCDAQDDAGDARARLTVQTICCIVVCSACAQESNTGSKQN